MKLRAIICVTAVFAASCALASVAEGKAQADMTYGNTFEGTCHLTGELELATPLGEGLAGTSFTGTGAGVCSGSLNGGPSEDHPTVNQITGLGSLSCAAGHTLTDDVLVLDHDRRIRVFTDTAFSATQGVGHFTGGISGDGVVEVNLLPYFDQSVMEECQNGTLSQVRYDLTAQTLTPLVG
jgi:hypothetical protein